MGRDHHLNRILNRSSHPGKLRSDCEFSVPTPSCAKGLSNPPASATELAAISARVITRFPKFFAHTLVIENRISKYGWVHLKLDSFPSQPHLLHINRTALSVSLRIASYRYGISEGHDEAISTNGELESCHPSDCYVEIRTPNVGIQAEGTSFLQIKDQLRRDITLRLHLESQQPAEDIAAQVGFESLTAFHRAFKAWTDITPLAYRRKGEQRTGDQRDPLRKSLR